MEEVVGSIPTRSTNPFDNLESTVGILSMRAVCARLSSRESSTIFRFLCIAVSIHDPSSSGALTPRRLADRDCSETKKGTCGSRSFADLQVRGIGWNILKRRNREV